MTTKATVPESVGIKELKARLSDYLDRIRGGERFVVTDRGEPVAELIPLSPERLALTKLARDGVVEWQGGKPKGFEEWWSGVSRFPRQSFGIAGDPIPRHQQPC